MNRFGIILGKPIYFVENEKVYSCEIEHSKKEFRLTEITDQNTIHDKINTYDSNVSRLNKLLNNMKREINALNPENKEKYLYMHFNSILYNTSDASNVKMIFHYVFRIDDFNDDYFLDTRRRIERFKKNKISSCPKKSSKISSEQCLSKISKETLKHYKSQWNPDPVYVDFEDDRLVLFDGNHRIRFLKETGRKRYIDAFVVVYDNLTSSSNHYAKTKKRKKILD